MIISEIIGSNTRKTARNCCSTKQEVEPDGGHALTQKESLYTQSWLLGCGYIDLNLFQRTRNSRLVVCMVHVRSCLLSEQELHGSFWFVENSEIAQLGPGPDFGFIKNAEMECVEYRRYKIIQYNQA